MVRFSGFLIKAVALFLSWIYAAGLPLAGLRGPALRGEVSVTAHSGCMGLGDNTVEAMEAGVAAGAEIVEFDLNFLADGTPVLSHDAPGDSDCATLADAFAFLAAHPEIHANVDVKSLAFIEKVQPMATEAGVLDRIFFTGVDENDVAAVARACPDIPYYLNTGIDEKEDFAALAEKTAALGAVGVNIHHQDASLSLSRAMHKKNLLVSVWTVNNEKDAVRVILTGADNITTRSPDMVCSLLRRGC